MQNSKIGWTHYTWNPWWGCNKVSAACRHCYIGQIMRRSGNEPFDGPMRTKTTWRLPFRWNRAAIGTGERLRIFTCSMSDFFHPGADKWRCEAWAIIQACQNLDWLILTKRPELIRDRLPSDWGTGYPNVWMGVTVEDQSHIKRIDKLAKIPAAVRFVSAEPLLGPVYFGRRLRQLDWVITGCEKAAKAKRRGLENSWVRNIRDECEASGVALFHKQYYQGNKIMFDGLIDGKIYQKWPASTA
ncbi:DUF5131 family protein [Bremerella sp. T1]|uniref:DUF5131 family protein n=1 Tax=Bremerella sp. TYQ1 TaxID=3119568 RepID=UPI001CC9A828|nr:DUF5131 family protein [Bremerella volcania]UBM33734.1 phage Gp37/Gp68 family protein [Bremerella volcania]